MDLEPPSNAAEESIYIVIANNQLDRTGTATISVIIPTLNEEAALPEVLGSLVSQADPPLFEVILADGGSRDRTVERFIRLTRAWRAPAVAARVAAAVGPARAAQMNAGARLASGGILLFLHADTLLPRPALASVVETLRDRSIDGGGFRLSYRDPGLMLRVIAAYATARSRIRRLHYGDQAMFVRRELFEDLGGFPEVSLFEDLRFARALRAKGRVRTLRLAVDTSARRLQRGGIGRTALHFAWLKFRHALGADPARLKSDYPDVR